MHCHGAGFKLWKLERKNGGGSLNPGSSSLGQQLAASLVGGLSAVPIPTPYQGWLVTLGEAPPRVAPRSEQAFDDWNNHDLALLVDPGNQGGSTGIGEVE